MHPSSIQTSLPTTCMSRSGRCALSTAPQCPGSAGRPQAPRGPLSLRRSGRHRSHGTVRRVRRPVHAPACAPGPGFPRAGWRSCSARSGPKRQAEVIRLGSAPPSTCRRADENVFENAQCSGTWWVRANPACSSVGRASGCDVASRGNLPRRSPAPSARQDVEQGGTTGAELGPTMPTASPSASARLSTVHTARAPEHPEHDGGENRRFHGLALVYLRVDAMGTLLSDEFS